MARDGLARSNNIPFSRNTRTIDGYIEQFIFDSIARAQIHSTHLPSHHSSLEWIHSFRVLFLLPGHTAYLTDKNIQRFHVLPPVLWRKFYDNKQNQCCHSKTWINVQFTRRILAFQIDWLSLQMNENEMKLMFLLQIPVISYFNTESYYDRISSTRYITAKKTMTAERWWMCTILFS